MQNESTDPMWTTHMKMLTKRIRNIEVAEKIDQALWEWYSERGREVPNWKKHQPEWWVNYLNELDEQEQ